MYRTKIFLPLIWPLMLLLTSCVTVNDQKGSQLEKASKINVQLGIGYYHRGNHELANEKLVKAMRQDPKSSQAHHAYAVLQNRFLDKVKAEFYFRKAVTLDPQNSEALNNFGAFLCTEERYEEANKMFMQAVENSIYRSPEVAFTSAAVCLMKQGASQTAQAKEYLKRALAIGSNYRPALINMASVNLIEKDYKMSSLYLKRFHLTGNATARSLWFSIQTEIGLGNNSKINPIAEKLHNNFPDSKEYKQWLALDL
ncbi:MAG: type IV pilus biogenesis/stability protein PilW [Gammaproteobacteria bacterium]|jgi:type IV pilus assembly protein PilF|nr:type IV pilus biogenesis/stability protein PilW [Gammaproteobacteria bacterium]MBT3724137.1 type IV pilus biogenesis/stability protein PilW [Gammaproteobacteria bacterium]MBT4452090.1 type IV pilus biogenesis/stability protein PilW [Gammaproteobacteria bacterium]MBT6454434.1 type IV pilus biogenesis/stability protein PilW [Gammaproteobacteria bacterium]MBT7047899.1 type IV pilus biogenesis/stability protein PilW [Gammaproteobacteria bacterium]